MNIILDTNILLSALIKDAVTRKIIVESGWNFFYPETSLHEIEKYKGLVLEKSELTENEYQELLKNIFLFVTLVSDGQTQNYLLEAKQVMDSIDPDDTIFIATALSLDHALLWSEDTHFERQTKIKVMKTKEILGLFLEEKNLL